VHENLVADFEGQWESQVLADGRGKSDFSTFLDSATPSFFLNMFLKGELAESYFPFSFCDSCDSWMMRSHDVPNSKREGSR
jgi:hypothetical protein